MQTEQFFGRNKINQTKGGYTFVNWLQKPTADINSAS
jgi:hypothetical protein